MSNERQNKRSLATRCRVIFTISRPQYQSRCIYRNWDHDWGSEEAPEGCGRASACSSLSACSTGARQSMRQLPPAWKIGEEEPMKGAMGRATRLDGLRQKLEGQGLKDVVYIVVNHQGEEAQRLHTVLAQRMTENITLYKQDPQQPDVWQTLSGEKDDFLIYDRCGRLTHHISLPYSIIGQGHVEGAIRDTYCKRICGDCTHESTESPEECKAKADAQPDTDVNPAVEEDTAHGHGHHHGHSHHHGRHHGHGHGHHGDNHPQGFGHGQDHNHGHHHGHHDGHDHGQSQQGLRPQEHGQGGGQQQADLGQMQHAVHTHQMSQEAHGAHVRP
ncbi:selenoprotein P [Lates japonicus]|uniref:Selenoprotein P n=1 Tax=Lates japonicus TaxID=270547 RepID=A0AAD3MSB7_LATJO|nr:selenoprotein P [Lates japonicus]